MSVRTERVYRSPDDYLRDRSEKTVSRIISGLGSENATRFKKVM